LERRDQINGGAVLVLGSAVVFFSRQLNYWSEYTPGPGFFPFWIGVGFLTCGLLLLLRKPFRTSLEEKRPFFSKKTWKVGFILMTLTGAIVLVPVLGLPTGLALFAGLSMRIAGRHSWILCTLAAASSVAGLHFVFGTLLDIPLPKGFLGW
jgi:putative tricarboxylic transport membrane protein